MAVDRPRPRHREHSAQYVSQFHFHSRSPLSLVSLFPALSYVSLLPLSGCFFPVVPPYFRVFIPFSSNPFPSQCCFLVPIRNLAFFFSFPETLYYLCTVLHFMVFLYILFDLPVLLDVLILVHLLSPRSPPSSLLSISSSSSCCSSSFSSSQNMPFKDKLIKSRISDGCHEV